MKNILFLGNSFTFFNDLPKMLRALCTSEGIEVCTDSVTRGGAYLHQFTDPADELSARLSAKITERKWDIVILQDQSANPAKKPDDLVSASKKIAALFPEGASFLMYQTWSYRADTDKLRSVKMTYPEMRRTLRDGYQAAASALGCTCVPVGDAFALASSAGIDVYCPDDFHPNPAGTFTAACLFMRTVFGTFPSSAPADLDPITAGICRSCAASC